MLVGKGMQGCVTLVAYAATPQAMRNYNKYVRGIHDGNYGMPHPVRKFDPPEKQK